MLGFHEYAFINFFQAKIFCFFEKCTFRATYRISYQIHKRTTKWIFLTCFHSIHKLKSKGTLRRVVYTFLSPKFNRFKTHKKMQRKIWPIFVTLGQFGANLSHKNDSKYIFPPINLFLCSLNPLELWNHPVFDFLGA